MDCARRVNEARMFSKNLVKVLLVGLAGACDAARFGAVIEDGHAEALVMARAPARRIDRWRELLPADRGVVAVPCLTVAALVVTVLLLACR